MLKIDIEWELMNSFVSGSSRDESQIVRNVSKDAVAKAIMYSFIHHIKWFSADFNIFKGDAVMLFIPHRLILVVLLSSRLI